MDTILRPITPHPKISHTMIPCMSHCRIWNKIIVVVVVRIFPSDSAKQKYRITACMCFSSKWMKRVPTGYRMVKARLGETLRQGIFLRAWDAFSPISFFKIRDSETAFWKKWDFETWEIWPKFCVTLTFCGDHSTTLAISCYCSLMFMTAFVFWFTVPFWRMWHDF